MFIIMVTEGFLMPGDDEVKHIGFAPSVVEEDSYMTVV
jgi:hypothetical protein